MHPTIRMYISFQTSGAVYRLNATVPDGCPDNADYTVMVRTNNRNPSFLDFYLEGETSGWIAVGFSPTDDMVCAHIHVHTSYTHMRT